MVYLECQKCGYIWNYMGMREYYATCPNCRTSVRITSQEIVRPKDIDEIKREQALRRLRSAIKRIEREKERAEHGNGESR